MSKPELDIAALTPEERLSLLEQLWDSLAATPEAIPLTEAQREELKRLCDEADVLDKSGELLTRTGAQQMIDELRHGVEGDPGRILDRRFVVADAFLE